MPRPGDPAFNPFPGLRPFQVEEEYLFFGREAQRQELVTLLKSHRFVAVLGASGSGKSSLVRAGLLPALFGGVMAGAGSHWNIAILRPGGSPLRNLAEALVETDLWPDREPPTALDLETTLSRSGLGLVEAVRQARMPANENLLVVVDQFEELFRFNQSQSERTTRDEASAFISLLLEAARQDQHSIYVVLTMRSDFFGDCAQFEELAEVVNKGEYLVPRLTRDQKKQAIEGPIKVGGGTIAPRLMQRLLSDVGDDPDQLPILQHALMRTWDEWNKRKSQRSEARLADTLHEPGAMVGRVALCAPGLAESGDGAHGVTRPTTETRFSDGVTGVPAPASAPPIDLEDYEAIGGMHEALSRHADEVFAALPDDRHRLVAEKIFKALTERGADNRGIRRATRLNQLGAIAGATDAEVMTVVEAFRRTGCTFLMPPDSTTLAPDMMIDISHESLMRVWQPLRRWVEDEAQSARIYRRLADTAALKAEAKAGLYHDPDLQIAISWRDAEHPTSAWAGRYHAGFAEAMGFLDQSDAVKRSEQEAREAARRLELEQARALAEAERRRAEEQQNYAGRLQWLVRGLGLVTVIALAAMVVAVVLRNEAEKNKELAEVRRQEAEQNRKLADAKAEEASQSARKVLRQAYRLQIAQAAEAIKQGDGGLAQEYLKNCDPSLRHWEWEHLALLADSSSHSIQAHTNGIGSIGLSQDGKWLISWSQVEGVIRLWDAADVATGKADQPVQSFFLHSKGWAPPIISPDGSWVSTYSRSNHQMTIRDIKTEKVIGELQIAEDLNDQQVSPDGKQIVLAFESGEVGLWNLADWKLKKWPTGSRWMGSVSFNRDGSLIAYGGGDGIPRIFNTSSGSMVREFPKVEGWITSIIFSPTGRHVAVGTWNGNVTVLQTAPASGPKELKLLSEGGGAASQFAFSPDGRWFAAAVGNAIQVWDAVLFETQTKLRGHKGSVNSVCFGSGGTTLFSAGADGTVKTWPMPGRQDRLALLGHKSDLRELAFSPDGQRLVSSGMDGTARIWDARTGQEMLTLRGEVVAPVTAVAWSPDGKHIVSGEGGGTNAINVWDARSGHLDRVLPAHKVEVWWLNFNPEGTILISGSSDNTVRLWDTSDWKSIGEIEGFQSPIEGAAFSPNGKLIATCEAGETGRVVLWDTQTRQEFKRFNGPKVRFRCTVFSHDGKRIAVGTYDNSACVWDVATGEFAKTERGSAGVSSVVFSSDDSRLFTGQRNGIIGVYDSHTGENMYSFAAGQSTIWCVRFSPDGKTLASSTLQTVQLWESSQIPELTVRQRWVVSDARQAVEKFEQHGKSLDQVLASIREDKSLSAEVRETARQIATAHGEQR